eukprot:scaffold80225_cov35-Prasinocladus_malaysianus.AAC.1
MSGFSRVFKCLVRPPPLLGEILPATSKVLVLSLATRSFKRCDPELNLRLLRVREDRMAWADSGDVYVGKGGKPWISEMYGYSFGCAKAGVWHVANHSIMLYPEYFPT